MNRCYVRSVFPAWRRVNTTEGDWLVFREGSTACPSPEADFWECAGVTHICQSWGSRRRG